MIPPGSILRPPPARRPVVVTALATARAFAAERVGADETSSSITVVPDLPRLDRDREPPGITLPWSAFGTTAVVVIVLALAAAAVFFIDRVTTAADERRRRSPPPSILGNRRR